MLAGWVALLLACVEYDTGKRQAADTTRQAALSLAKEAEHAEIVGWAHEIRAWINLTTCDYHVVIAAAQARTAAAPHHAVSVQLAAQEAKSWAQIGDRRQTEVALDRGCYQSGKLSNFSKCNSRSICQCKPASSVSIQPLLLACDEQGAIRGP